MMVKINQTNDTGQIRPRQPAAPAGQSKTENFQNVLGDALSKSENTSTTGGTMVNALEEIPAKQMFIPPTDAAANNQVMAERTDQLLGMLDRYTAQLMNPDVPLKTVAPALEEIKTLADNLLSETSGNIDLSPEMKQIATETAVMANTTYLKFQRGDFLS